MSPQGGGQAHCRQVQRPQQQGLDGVAVLVDQQPAADLPVRDQAPPVSGRLVGEEDERPQGQAGVEGVHRDHRAVVAGVGTLPVPQEDGHPRRRLEQAPGTLEQNIQQPLHFTRSRRASSPSGVTWAVS